MLKPAYNPTDSPVVIDDDGRILGGREWGAVDPDTDRVGALVTDGQLVVRDALPKDADPAVVDAVQAAMDATGGGYRTPQSAQVTPEPEPVPVVEPPKSRSPR